MRSFYTKRNDNVTTIFLQVVSKKQELYRFYFYFFINKESKIQFLFDKIIKLF